MSTDNVTNAIFALLITSLYVMGHDAFHLGLSLYAQLIVVRLVLWRIELVLNWRGTLKVLLLCVPNQALFFALLGGTVGPYAALSASVLAAMWVLQSENRWYGACIRAALAGRGAWFEGDALVFRQYEAFYALYQADLRAQRKNGQQES